MVDFCPLSMRLILPSWAARVASPAHDALTPAQRRAHLEANPSSYLGVTRSPDELTEAAGHSPTDLLHEGRAALDRLMAAGAFGPPRHPVFYAYEPLQRGTRFTVEWSFVRSDGSTASTNSAEFTTK